MWMLKKNIYIVLLLMFFVVSALFFIKKYADPLYYSCSYEEFVAKVYDQSVIQIVAEAMLPFETELLPVYYKINQVIFGYENQNQTDRIDHKVISNVGNRYNRITELKLVRFKNELFNVKEFVINKKLCFLLIITNRNSSKLSQEIIVKIKNRFPKLTIKMMVSDQDSLKYFDDITLGKDRGANLD